MDRAGCNEYAIDSGPFEWGTCLQEAAAEWHALGPDECELALEHAASEQEAFLSIVSYCTEAFDDFVEIDLQELSHAQHHFLSQRLQTSFSFG